MKSRSFSNRKGLVLLLLFLAVLILFPFKKTIVPSRRVLVVTQDMHPVKDALVRQTWQDYSLERTGHEEDLSTDLQGRVTFPARTIRANLVWRVLGPLATIGGQGLHASFGVHTDMFPIPNEGREASSETMQPSPDEIVYRVNL
jgi:hypothetical protein